jgi:hypothetical protein
MTCLFPYFALLQPARIHIISSPGIPHPSLLVHAYARGILVKKYVIYVYQHSAAVLTKFFASLVLAILENQSPQGRFPLGKYNRDQLRGTAFGKFTMPFKLDT